MKRENEELWFIKFTKECAHTCSHSYELNNGLIGTEKFYMECYQICTTDNKITDQINLRGYFQNARIY